MSPNANSIVTVVVDQAWANPVVDFLVGQQAPAIEAVVRDVVVLIGRLEDARNMPGLVLRRSAEFKRSSGGTERLDKWETFIPWKYVVACFSNPDWTETEDARQYGFAQPQ